MHTKRSIQNGYTDIKLPSRMHNPYLVSCIRTMQGSENPAGDDPEDDGATNATNPAGPSEEDLSYNPGDLHTFLRRVHISVVGDLGEITQFYEDRSVSPVTRTYELQHGQAVLGISNVSAQPIALRLQYFNNASEEDLRSECFDWNLSPASPHCAQACSERCRHSYCTHACACNCTRRTYPSQEHDVDAIDAMDQDEDAMDQDDHEVLRDDHGDDGWCIADAHGHQLLRIVFTTEKRKPEGGVNHPAGDLVVPAKRRKPGLTRGSKTP